MNILGVEHAKHMLAVVLDRIAIIDPSAKPVPAGALPIVDPAAYAERYRLVMHAMYLAVVVGYPAGVGIHADEPAWPVFFIELPTGQVSWHMPAHPDPYDGHTVAEKYERIAQFGGQI